MANIMNQQMEIKVENRSSRWRINYYHVFSSRYSLWPSESYWYGLNCKKKNTLYLMIFTVYKWINEMNKKIDFHGILTVQIMRNHEPQMKQISGHSRHSIRKSPPNLFCFPDFRTLFRLNPGSRRTGLQTLAAACAMSSATCNTILLKNYTIERILLIPIDFKINNFSGCVQDETKIANVWHPLCILQCFIWSSSRCKLQEKCLV